MPFFFFFFFQQYPNLGKQSREMVGCLLALSFLFQAQSLPKNQFIMKPIRGFMSTVGNYVTLLEGVCI